MNFYDRLRKLGHEDYEDYLRSAHWRNFRRNFYRYKNRISCECCGADEDVAISLHHKTYDQLGCETFDDVMMLCEDCHERVHHGGYGGSIEQQTKNLVRDVSRERLIRLFQGYVRSIRELYD